MTHLNPLQALERSSVPAIIRRRWMEPLDEVPPGHKGDSLQFTSFTAAANMPNATIHFGVQGVFSPGASRRTCFSAFPGGTLKAHGGFGAATDYGVAHDEVPTSSVSLCDCRNNSSSKGEIGLSRRPVDAASLAPQTVPSTE